MHLFHKHVKDKKKNIIPCTRVTSMDTTDYQKIQCLHGTCILVRDGGRRKKTNNKCKKCIKKID